MSVPRLKIPLPIGVKVAITVISILSILTWTSWQSLKSISALATLKKPQLNQTNQMTNPDHHKIRRSIQKHFLGYGVYIPLEDIVLPKESTNSQDKLTFLMRNACGQAKLYVWVPLKIRLPYFGGKTWEWCWKLN